METWKEILLFGTLICSIASVFVIMLLIGLG